MQFVTNCSQLFGSNTFDYQTCSQFLQYHAYRYVQRSSVWTFAKPIVTDRQIHHDSGQTIVTLPETNIAPENRPLEKDIPIGNHHFRGYVSFRELYLTLTFLPI